MEFGERVKAVRMGAGLTQEQFASRLGVTRQAVSNWENGRNLPDIEVVIAISRTFGVSLDELILGGRDMGREKDAKAEKDALADSEAANTSVITTSQKNMVLISRSMKNIFKRPFHTSRCKVKLMAPQIISTMSTSSTAKEW